ncbi:MAG TPA: efflux RND transporter periplasmic adaptor subunit [Bacteroidota bacterium]|nr:efflux RND transporter periplasmic adaptor subunit [Bacteroidota bacterium]
MKSLRKYVYGAITIIAIGGVGYYAFFGNTPKAESTPSGQIQRIVKVSRGDLNLNVSADGVVTPINLVEIKSKASGQIVSLNFVEGLSVQKGELLLELDQTTAKNDFEQAKADLAVAESNATQAENNHRRALELFQKGLISEQERDQSNLEFVRAKAQLVKAKAALSSADERLRDTRIVAPISGIILTKNVELGQIISSGVSNVGGGTLIATIANMDNVHVVTNVDEVDIGRVQVGQRARVKADAHPDDTFFGEIIRISPQGKTQQNVTTFNVIVLVPNIGGKLKAGMSASVDIEIFNRPQVLLVPNEALRDPLSTEGRQLMAVINERRQQQEGPPKSEPVAERKEGEKELTFEELRERMRTASPEEREKLRPKMREMIQKMSPGERQKVFAEMQQRMGNGGGAMVFGGGGDGNRMRRQSQVGNIGEIRERIVFVKEGDQFTPKLVKVGASNFDFTEVVDGLNENDEVQVVTVSRAKIASEEFNQRMRSMQGVGGLGGGRAPTGGGRR